MNSQRSSSFTEEVFCGEFVVPENIFCSYLVIKDQKSSKTVSPLKRVDFQHALPGVLESQFSVGGVVFSNPSYSISPGDRLKVFGFKLNIWGQNQYAALSHSLFSRGLIELGMIGLILACELLTDDLLDTGFAWINSFPDIYRLSTNQCGVARTPCAFKNVHSRKFEIYNSPLHGSYGSKHMILGFKQVG